ncbi:MAG TPA: ATP-binding cassette domain-containing protein [Stellaceae bacterium]|nr:ATP-binding cassette domain-containing protein [Stellaceae bacterium]
MRGRIAAPLPWLAGLLALYLIAPLAAGLRAAASANWGSVDGAALAHACAVSLASASLATALIALGGVPLGYLLARLPGRAMAALGFLVQLPLALPPLASGILLLFLVGYDAPLGHLTGGVLTDSFAGIVLCEVFVAAPFLIIAARSAFAAMDRAVEGVAATLGRGPFATFFRISLPIAWPTITSGLLLAWLRAFGEFGATVMVAYHPYSLPVYTYVAFGAEGLPAMLPILLPTLALAIVVLALSEGFARQRRQRRSPPQRANRTGPAPGAGRIAAIPGPADPPGLVVKLTKRLDGFHLEIDWSARSRRLAILGPSGSGKSLILRLIAGIDDADRATIRLGGRDLSHLAPARREIAYLPQSYGLFPHLTVAEQLRFAVGARPAAVRHWIERLGLAGLEHRYPAALSLGQQQRAALARALVRPSRLLLLDEPFSALDAPLRARLRVELLALQREIGATTILVTHDPEEAALLADELLVIEDGRPLQSGPTEAVFLRPASETVARLLGAENAAAGVAVDGGRIAIGGGVALEVAGPPLRPGLPVGWSIRPGGVRLSVAGPYRGCIEGLVPLGLGSRITVRLGDSHIQLLTYRPHRLGEAPCRLDIDPCAVQVWPRV